MKRVAIITARGGSKRIPRKNIRAFAGRPILEYSIEAAVKSGAFTEVMVSTDDQEIAEAGRRAGAAVPFLRSPQNSNDFATTADVIREVLEAYRSRGQEFESFCCIYPTAPFVTAEKLSSAMSQLESTGADSVVPVVRFGYPIQRALKIEGGLVSMIEPANVNKRSQDLMPAFHDCGQFYGGNVKSFLASGKLFAERTVPIVMPESEVQDIDTEEDWKIAELKFRLMQEHGRS